LEQHLAPGGTCHGRCEEQVFASELSGDLQKIAHAAPAKLSRRVQPIRRRAPDYFGMVTIPNPCEGWSLSRKKTAWALDPADGSNEHSKENFMNSFTLTAVGNIAADLKLEGTGDNQYCRFAVMGNDYAGKDRNGNPREVTTSIYFVAFGATAKALANNVRKGDQVIVQARVQANNWTDENREKRYDHSFIVEGFKFGRPGKETREILAKNAA